MKTKTANEAGKTPSWTDQFHFKINGESQMYVRIFDKDVFSSDDFVAEGHIPL